jgi:hypothetical protein
VDTHFLDADGQALGSVWYAAATTAFIFTNWLSDPTQTVNQIQPGSFDS